MSNLFKLSALSAAILSVGLMSGCAMDSEITKESHEELSKADKITTDSINGLKSEILNSKQTPMEKYMEYSYGPILNVQAIPLVKPLPNIFSKKVDFIEPFTVSADNFLIKASKIIGMQIEVEDDVMDELKAESKKASASSSSSISGSASMDSLDSTGNSLGGSESLFSEDMSGPRMSLSQSGTVKELLNSISSLFLGSKWRYDENLDKVIIYKYETKTFYIPSIPGGYKMGSEVKGSNSANSATFETSQNVWESIKNDIASMTEGRGSFTLSESSGILTVRAGSSILDRVESYVKKVKEGMSSQVLIDVKVYSVIQDKKNRKDLNLEVLFKEAGLTSTIKGATGSIITNAASMVLGSEMDVAEANRKGLAGSNGILTLLESQGDTSVIASNTIRTVNNQPSALTTSDTESYLEKKEVTLDSTTGTTQTNLTVSEKTTGLSMHVLPTLDENGKDMLLQISFTLSKIKGYNTYDTGDGNQVNTPIISSRDFVEKVWLKSGETLVLTGFDVTETGKEGAGALDKDWWALGGSAQDTVKKEKLVIVITPAVYNAVTAHKL